MSVAIVDFGMGNLFSVSKALEHVGIEAIITSSPECLREARAVVLPGMGAFGDAMQELRARRLVEPLRNFAQSGRPFLGICLGLQLLLEKSEEFGLHEGLGVMAGRVVRFDAPKTDERALKVPQVGWNALRPPRSFTNAVWLHTPLEGLKDGVQAYFAHSYHALPSDPSNVLATSRYGNVEFASALRRGSVFGLQFHPERSGARGIDVYHAFAKLVRDQ